MNTTFALLAEYGTAQIPLDRCCALFGLDPPEAARRAGRQALPVPVYRLGSQKSPWIVDVAALAHYLDTAKARAAAEWQRIHRDVAA